MIDGLTIKPIGIGEIKFLSEDDTLRIVALGSCIGVVVYDVHKGVAGMAHIALPNMSREDITKPEKFADYCIPVLIQKLRRKGAKNLKAKIAGGSSMFSENREEENIGHQNMIAVKYELSKLGIPIVAHDCLDKWSRTITLKQGSFDLHIKRTKRIGNSSEYEIERFTI